MGLLLFLALLLPVSSFADGMHDHLDQPQATFSNRINSYAMVSPAQIRRSDNVVTDVIYDVRRIRYRDNNPANERDHQSFAWTDSKLTATILYSLPNTNLNLGVSVASAVGSRGGYSLYLGNFDVEGGARPDLQSLHTKYWRIDSLTISPMASYWINDVVSVGVRVDNHQVHRDYAVEGLDISGIPYRGNEGLTTVMPAVSMTTDNVEAGVAYRFLADDNLLAFEGLDVSDKNENSDFNQPDYLLIHGRYAIVPTMKIGAIYRFERYSTLRTDSDDRSQISLNGDFQLDNVAVECEVTHAMPFYDKRADISASNIATTAARTAVDYQLLDNASLGAGIGYRYGADKEANIEYRVSELAMTVRGSYLF